MLPQGLTWWTLQWSRLVGAKSPQKAYDPSDSQHRLTSFKRAYSNLLQLWRNGDTAKATAFTPEKLRICLARLSEILNDEVRGRTPHLCISFAAGNRLLTLIVKVASTYNDEGITNEVLNLLNVLGQNEEEAFLEEKSLADAMPSLTEVIQRNVAQSLLEWDVLEEKFLGVLFGIAQKLRLEPLVLTAWFRPEDRSEAMSPEEKSVLDFMGRKTPLEEFPLFYTLLHYIPYKGRTGEFARMGLLYIVEAASSSPNLENWIVGGDMADLMASGLGALYSQLSRKLSLNRSDDGLPAILTYSENAPRRDTPATSNFVDDREDLSTFLASLVFWQDLLDHALSRPVKNILIENFKSLFLQQLLYPSLIESSDVDGGSSIAVLTYLRHILDSLEHAELVEAILSYLSGVQNGQDLTKSLSVPPSPTLRKSMTDASQMQEDLSPSLFNLRDLILTSLGSDNQQTITTTLQLFSVLLSKQHHRLQRSIVNVRTSNSSSDRRTYGGHNKEVDVLLTLAESILNLPDSVNESLYDSYSYDCRNALETHACTIDELTRPLHMHTASEKSIVKIGHKYRTIDKNDRVVKRLLELFDNFFANDIETNLALTRAFLDLGCCGEILLEGWMVTSPTSYKFKQELPESTKTKNEEQPEQQQKSNTFATIDQARHEPAWSLEDASLIYKTLDRLQKQIESFQHEVEDLDLHLETCRGVLAGGNLQIASPLGSPLLAPTTPAKIRDTAPQTPSRVSFEASSPSIAAVFSHKRTASKDLPLPPVDSTSKPRGRPAVSQHSAPRFDPLEHIRLSPAPRSTSNAARDVSGSPLRIVRPKRASINADLRPLSLARSPLSPSPRRNRDSPMSKRVPVQNGTKRPRKVVHDLYTSTDDESDENERSAFPKTLSDDEDEDDGPDLLASRRRMASTKDVDSPVKAESGESSEQSDNGTVSLGHLCTNIIILHDFILEMAALISVRGALFDEVRFTMDQVERDSP